MIRSIYLLHTTEGKAPDPSLAFHLRKIVEGGDGGRGEKEMT